MNTVVEFLVVAAMLAVFVAMAASGAIAAAAPRSLVAIPVRAQDRVRRR
ncbi:hypothetical protein [Nocardia vermiculata]|uniref:Uncharacterized protein n=1 Tax=Nocardia vermiculata TaxID=257274 RepID=A0A846XTR6_9NOCA|nr:hypothetical protein [Nocardia vermiculata]NKY50017.1 hypothetical protein [Nocardia vermiculata]